MGVPKRVSERFVSKLKSFQTVLPQQRDRDVSEADTVTLVKDMLNEVFGYDKYAELTSEHSVRGTYCDLAAKIEGKLVFLLEVKAIGVDLKDSHVKQAVDYASNQGCEYVVLTNAIEWRIYKVLFKKPIEKLEVSKFNLLEVDAKDECDCECLYLLSREGFVKDVLRDHVERQEATSRYMLAAIILHSEPVQNAMRREIRRVSDILVTQEDIDKMLRADVLKREAIEGEAASAAARRVTRSSDKSIIKGGERGADHTTPTPTPVATPSVG